jgi:hypothetical protein
MTPHMWSHPGGDIRFNPYMHIINVVETAIRFPPVLFYLWIINRCCAPINLCLKMLE